MIFQSKAFSYLNANTLVLFFLGTMVEAIEDYRQVTDIDERQFQKISLDRQIYPIPVDEVSRQFSVCFQHISCHLAAFHFQISMEVFL